MNGRAHEQGVAGGRPRHMKFSTEVGPIHFIGIGGIGMSGIAEVLHALGYAVQGSDLKESANVERLRAKGIPVAVGHRAENLGAAEIVVVSSAIRADNPELRAARERHLPVVRRAEMLAELMRFRNAIAVGGTHGKTTTTSLIGELLVRGGLDPTIVNGGIINDLGTNVRIGAGEWMVAEADESDGTFVRLPADVVVVTNIDPEHLDFYGDFEKEREAFLQFVQNIPFYGFAVMCTDHPEVQALAARVVDRRVITYGTNPQADVRVMETVAEGDASRFSVRITDRRTGEVTEIPDLLLKMPGEHNVLNATAAVAIAHQLGIPPADIRAGLAQFGGVRRRFTLAGEWNGVRVYDDYGHHPVEIAAVLRAARRVAGEGRVIAVKQPHRYSRLKSLFDEFTTCFNEADVVILAPVYPAGEAPVPGVDHEALAQALRDAGHRDVRTIAGREALPAVIRGIVRPGDVVICLGAGDISAWAHELPAKLAEA
jgi:UDP-N-acetylmuramate--alanine ligase